MGYLIPLLVVPLAFFVFIVRPQRQRLAAHRALVESLQLGDRVMLTCGIFGTVRALRGEALELEIAPDLSITVVRGAVARRMEPRELESTDADHPGEAD